MVRRIPCRKDGETLDPGCLLYVVHVWIPVGRRRSEPRVKHFHHSLPHHLQVSQLVQVRRLGGKETRWFAAGTDLILIRVPGLIPRFSVAITSFVVTLQAMEVFPTSLRSTGSGFASLVGSVAAIAAPLIVYLVRMRKIGIRTVQSVNEDDDIYCLLTIG